MFTPPCFDVCFLSELSARICLNMQIIPIFFNFFPAETRLNRPDLNLNQGDSHLNRSDSNLNRAGFDLNQADLNLNRLDSS